MKKSKNSNNIILEISKSTQDDFNLTKAKFKLQPLCMILWNSVKFYRIDVFG